MTIIGPLTLLNPVSGCRYMFIYILVCPKFQTKLLCKHLLLLEVLFACLEAIGRLCCDQRWSGIYRLCTCMDTRIGSGSKDPTKLGTSTSTDQVHKISKYDKLHNFVN